VLSDQEESRLEHWNLKVEKQPSQATGHSRSDRESQFMVVKTCSRVQWSGLHCSTKIIEADCTQERTSERNICLLEPCTEKVCPENKLRKLWRYVLLVRACVHRRWSRYFFAKKDDPDICQDRSALMHILYACVVYVVPFHVFKLGTGLKCQVPTKPNKRPATGLCYLWHSLADGGHVVPHWRIGGCTRTVQSEAMKHGLKFADHPCHAECTHWSSQVTARKC